MKEERFDMPLYRAQGFWMLMCALCCVALAAISALTPDMESAGSPIFGLVLTVLGLAIIVALGFSCYMLDQTAWKE